MRDADEVIFSLRSCSVTAEVLKSRLLAATPPPPPPAQQGEEPGKLRGRLRTRIPS